MSTQTESSLDRQFVETIATELHCTFEQVQAADGLLADGATVPFIARYRKEATAGLDDDQLEKIDKRRTYFLELTERRAAILESIKEQEKLTPALETAIRQAETKNKLEDLYLPFKRKRRTRAQAARERGLEPLAERILATTSEKTPAEELAVEFVDSGKKVPDEEAALSGARDILAEQFSESADRRSRLRDTMRSETVMKVKVVNGKKDEGAVYRDYFEYEEPLSKIASHRLLAILRGERQGILTPTLQIDDTRELGVLGKSWECPLDTPCGQQIQSATEDGYKRLLRPSISNEVKSERKEEAELEAIAVFRANLEDLLMQSPIGDLPVMGVDPGYRTGCKLAVVDATGRVVDTGVIYPVPPKAKEEESAKTVIDLVKKHRVQAIAIGNGTGSRETESFARKAIASVDFSEVLGDAPDAKVVVAIVPETGASVYSASEVARQELPDLDVSIRGAVSIARRLQDPLAELVKIDPKALGVGQYQHDVDQKALRAEIDNAVERVVNRVGVELNTASPALLHRVSGLTERLARSIIRHRDTHGPFKNRDELLQVDGFGPKAFEQSAGFLRIRDSEQSLDGTAVHPERYSVVQSMAQRLGVQVGALVGNPELVVKLDFDSFTNVEEGIGAYTLEDIREELERPARDPRPEFKIPEWNDEIRSIDDLKKDLVVEGRVSNVTNFGAFIDLGVKRDGLVHVSELTHHWVEDPRNVVHVGQVVKAKVLDVDTERGRVSLSLKALEPAPAASARTSNESKAPRKPRPQGSRSPQRSDDKPKASRDKPPKPNPQTDEHRSRKKKSEQKQKPERPTTIEDLLEKWGKQH